MTVVIILYGLSPIRSSAALDVDENLQVVAAPSVCGNHLYKDVPD